MPSEYRWHCEFVLASSWSEPESPPFTGLSAKSTAGAPIVILRCRTIPSQRSAPSVDPLHHFRGQLLNGLAGPGMVLSALRAEPLRPLHTNGHERADPLAFL